MGIVPNYFRKVPKNVNGTPLLFELFVNLLHFAVDGERVPTFNALFCLCASNVVCTKNGLRRAKGASVSVDTRKYMAIRAF